jgi:uncharacterized membrane protein (UPF0182 family)
MEESLEGGLARLFGGGAPLLAQRGVTEPAPARVTTAVAANAEAIRRAVTHYERARAAQRADDWATYGEEMRVLGELLRQLDTAAAPRP